MEKITSKIKKPNPKTVVIGVMGVFIFGHFLDRFGLLPYTIGFLWGVVFTIAAEIWAIYFFLLKMESKGSEKLETFVTLSSLF